MSEELDMTDSVLISIREYKSLLDDSEMLRELYSAGVRNWDGYAKALRKFER